MMIPIRPILCPIDRPIAKTYTLQGFDTSDGKSTTLYPYVRACMNTLYIAIGCIGCIGNETNG
jgi:hypothetical protein